VFIMSSSWSFVILMLLSCMTQRTLQSNPDGAMLTRFRNIANYDIVLWWVTPYSDEEIRFFGHLQRNGGMTSFTSYVGHEFFWAKPNEQHDPAKRRQFFKIQKDKILYLYVDANDPGADDVVDAAHEEVQFLSEYYRTYNRHWLSTYQRPPPEIPFIAMDDDNSRKKWVTSDSFFWTCDPSKSDSVDTDSKQNTGGRLSRFLSRNGDSGRCRDTQPLRFMVEQLYEKDPRVYKISNFIHPFEAKHIIEISQKYMERSTVGDGRNRRQDPTRTCTNTWLSMNHTRIVETLYHRIGDVLGIAKWKMNVKSTVMDNNGNVEGVASHMEVIHFGTSEHYSRHYDNAVNDEIYLHFITFQVILQTSEDFSGGQTGFPHAGSVERGNQNGFQVENEQYSAIFWYNLLPDGNLDETSMYSNLRVNSGEQWMFHVSIWDPTLPVHGDPKMPHDIMYAMHDEL